jgi:TAP-like protein
MMLIFRMQHTSLCAPSRCTAKAIHAYFQNGTLPVPGTVCEADLVPFESFEIPPLKEDIARASDLDYDIDSALLHLMLAPMMPASF